MRLLGRKLTAEQISLLQDGTKVYIKENNKWDGSSIKSGVATKKENRITKERSGGWYVYPTSRSIETGDAEVFEYCETDEMDLITFEQALKLEDGTVVFADDESKSLSGCYTKKGDRLENPYGTNGYCLDRYCKDNLYTGRRVELYVSKIEKEEIDMKFKVGDRVKALVTVGGNYVENATGVVVEVDYDEEQCYLVNFNEEIDGHGEDNRCWWMENDEIELIKETEKVFYNTPLKTSKRAKKHGYTIGDKVRNIKNGEIGTVIDFSDGGKDDVGVCYDNPVGTHTCSIGVNGNHCDIKHGRWFKPSEIELISGIRGLRTTTPIFDETFVSPVNDVEITVKGRKITASYKGFVGVARCNPEDDFNESYGIGLALERLGAEIKAQGEKEIKEIEESKIPTLDIDSYREFLDGKVGVKFESFDGMKEFLKKLDGIVKWMNGENASEYIPYDLENLIYVHKDFKVLLNDREEYCKERFNLKVVKYK